MTNLNWIIRTTLISCIVAVAVYAHGRSHNLVIERFHKIAYADPNTLWRNRWLGISALQNPNDAWIIQEIIAEVKPDYIIEAGTYMGGSAVLWAMILREINPAGKVIIAQKMITFMIGSSTDPKIVSEIARQVQGKRVVVILDSDHSSDHVLKEMQSYGPMVNIGSYLIVQDSDVNGHPIKISHGEGSGPGPWEAIDAFLPSNQNFNVDSDRERLLYTTNPRGYLKRIN